MLTFVVLLTVSIFSTNVNAQVPKADLLDIVFNDDGTASDISPLQNEVKAVGTPIVVKSPMYGMNVLCANQNEWGQNPEHYYRIELTDALLQGISDGMSFETYVRPHWRGESIPSDWISVFGMEDSGGFGMILKNGTWRFEFRVNDKYEIAEFPDIPVKDQWIHFVGVWDKNQGTLSLYVDGFLSTVNQNASGEFGLPGEDNRWFCIGADPDGSNASAAFRGDIAFSRLYNEPLNANQIAALYDDMQAKKTGEAEHDEFSNIDDEGYYLLGTLEDWKSFVAAAREGKALDKYRLSADIDGLTIEDMCPTFGGIFDGQGYALTMEMETDEENCAPFAVLTKGAVVKNLWTKGTISSSNKYAAGVASQIYGATLLNCVSSVEITDTYDGEAIVGGMVGMVWGPSTFQNCAFAGMIDASNAYCIAAIAGKEGTGTSSMFQNCLANGDGLLAKDIEGKNSYFVCSDSGSDTYINNVYTENYMLVAPQSGTNNMISTNQMENGTACYMLNGNQEEIVFRQNLGEGDDADLFPVPFSSHRQVYASQVDCAYKPVEEATFSNEFMETIIGEHQYLEDFCTLCGKMDPDFTGDAPEAIDGVYQIKTARQLFWFAHQVTVVGNFNISCLLLNDIDVSKFDWIPIGGADVNQFWGVFDGGGHTVTVNLNKNIDANWAAYGFFGCTPHAVIKNLNVKGSLVCKATGACNMFGTIARAWDAKISNVHSSLNVNVKPTSGSGFFGVGGLVGFAQDASIISDCSYDGTLTCNNGDPQGGIVGYAWGTEINNCACYGKFQMSANGTCGGIIGFADNAGIVVSNCLSTATFSGEGTIASLIPSVSNMTFDKSVNNYWLTNESVPGSWNEQFANSCVGATVEELASGKIAYSLNLGQEDKHWFQNLGEDAYPVLDNTHKKVSLTDEGAYINKGELDPNGIEPAFADGFYQIKNVENMLWFSSTVNKGNGTINAVLTADIDMSDVKDWKPIGVDPDVAYFSGIFDGQGHTVKGCNFNTQLPIWDCGGLFGCVIYGTVKNVTVKGTLECNGDICSMFGTIGRAWSATISRVHSSLDITLPGTGYFGVGGIVGYAHDNTTITECTYSGTLTANNSTDAVGGILGRAAATTIVNCANWGTLSCQNSGCFLGGILGWGNDASFGGIQNCVSTGSVTCSAEEGGNVGALAATLDVSAEKKCVNNYWVEGSANRAADIDMTQATAIKPADISNGALCFYLNQGQEEPHWFQTIGTDSYPVLDNTHERVIMGGNGGYINPGSINPLGVEPELVDGVYQIKSTENLLWFALAVNSGQFTINGVLVNDVDLSPIESWAPIGISPDRNAYWGTFDGQGHTVSNLNISAHFADWGCVGLFGAVVHGSVKNLTVQGRITCDASACGMYGAIGRAWDAKISNIHSSLKIIPQQGSYFGVGGIVGYAHDNTFVDDCYFDGIIYCTNGQQPYGGLIGSASQVHINNCANYGTMDMQDNTEAIAGGICGSIDNAESTMTNCLNVGSLTQNGGFIGSMIGLVYNISTQSNNNYWLEGTSEVGARGEMSVTCVPAGEMASGSVAYALNEGQETMHWYQRIGSDKYPMLDEDHGVVLKTEEGYKNEGINPNGIEPELVDGVYQIKNAENLLWFALAVNSGQFNINGALIKDVDLSPIESWTPIGISPDYNAYWGTFDGQGHTVSNLNISAHFGDWGCVGLFGAVVHGGVKNLTVQGKLTCNSGACAMYGAIGRAWDAKLSNIHSSLEIEPQEGSYYGVGGVVGYAHDNTFIDDCDFTGTIHCTNGQQRYGGLVGMASLVHINNCANYGTMDLHDNTDALVGGICGSTDNAECTMTNCLNAGNVTQNGGFIGSMIGLIYNISADCKNNYWLEGTSEVGARGEVNVTCVTAAEMASGAIAYALNEGQEAAHWYQTLGSDPYPVLDATHGLVEKSGDDYTNGIASVKTGNQSDEIYDLQGRRVTKMSKGLYIMNGKKILVK